METLTFVYTNNTVRGIGHWNSSIVTVETKADCVEKYFLKYPLRREALVSTDPDLKLEIIDGAVEFPSLKDLGFTPIPPKEQ